MSDFPQDEPKHSEIIELDSGLIKICLLKCKYGNCALADDQSLTCECDKGYELSDDKQHCNFICSLKCTNGSQGIINKSQL